MWRQIGGQPLALAAKEDDDLEEEEAVSTHFNTNKFGNFLEVDPYSLLLLPIWLALLSSSSESEDTRIRSSMLVHLLYSQFCDTKPRMQAMLSLARLQHADVLMFCIFLATSETCITTAPWMQVHKDKLTAQYTGQGAHNNDVGAIQGNRPVPRKRKIYYYEVLVNDRGERGLIGIGFADKNFKMGKQPG
jgi:hypothetical protein